MDRFARIFIRKKDNLSDPTVRARCGRNVGIVGIVLNTLLAAAKIAFGTLSGMLSVTADGLNNLTDCSGNIISVIGFKMSAKPADKEHPYGHRRAEPISSLLIAVLVLVVAFELLISSAKRIFQPVQTQFTVALAVVLGVSVLIKFCMYVMTKSVGKTIQSGTLQANAADNISDAFATSVVLISTIVAHYADWNIDGYLGVAVSVFIAITGIKLMKDTVFGLLGTAPTKQSLLAIKQCIMHFDGVRGMHDLNVHDYGKNYRYATVHLEVDSHMDLLAAHSLADAVEHAVEEQTGTVLTVHIDPLEYDNPTVNRLRGDVIRIVSAIDPTCSVHDFRTVGEDGTRKLIFDVAVPFDCTLSNAEIERRIRQSIALLDEHCRAAITVERQNTV